MRRIIGLILMVAGILVGIYVGFWLCFIGGIVGIINAVKGPEPATVGVIAWNGAKIVFAAAAGWISAYIFILPALALIMKKDKKGQ